MSEKFVRVAVLMGGRSDEHEVSLNSGRGVVKALAKTPYEALPVVIGHGGDWQFGDEAPISMYDAIPRLRDLGVGCVFIALHGTFGEDGRVQGLLDLLGMPYTGSGCAASALAMDKVRSKTVVSSQGVPVAAHVSLDRATWEVDRQAAHDAVVESVGFPCVIKPSLLGSSVGIEIPKEEAELDAAMDRVFQVAEEVLAEEFITGTEVTCAVLDAETNGLIRPLPVTEIRPKTAKFFDYEAKYTPGATEEITPARLSAELTGEIQEMAAHVHETVGCAGWSRSDFIIGPEGPVWIEVNTVPGLTETSLYPQACAAAGISYTRMVVLFIEHALRRAQREA